MRGVLSRGLSSTIKTELASNAVQVAVLIRLELNANFHLTTSSTSITYDSNTYTSTGVFLNIADFKEESTINTSEISLQLGNASQTIMNDLLTNGHIDRTVKIWLALINASAAVIDAPFQIFQGQINKMSITESESNSVTQLGIANHWAQLNQFSGRRLTDSSQQRFFNGDICFDFVNQVDKPIIWGTVPIYDSRTHTGQSEPGVLVR